MADGTLAREALERKEAWAFLVEGVRVLLASSPEFRERCREMLGSGRGCLEFEMDLRGAGRVGSAVGAGRGVGGAVMRGTCGSRMRRRLVRGAAVRWRGALYTASDGRAEPHKAAPDVIPIFDAAQHLPGFHLATGFSGHGFGIGPRRRQSNRRAF